MKRPSAGLALSGFLIGAGVSHFVVPGFYDPIVPHALPGPPRGWTYASGLAEIAVGTAVAVPEKRSRAALLAAALFVAVFPANVQQAVDAKTTKDRAIAYMRLPIQVPLVVWALKVSRASRRRGSHAPAR